MPLTRRKLLNALIPASIISLFTTKDAFSDVTLGKKSKVDIQNENIISQTDTSKTLRILDSLDGASKVRARNNETVEQSLQTLDSKMLKLEKFVFKDDFEVAEQYNIPGDFTDLQEAINHLSNRNVSANKYIILNIQSGYRISSGVKVQHGDYSRFYIQSEDSIVYIADDFEGVSGPDGKNTITDGTVILAYHARGPVLGCIIDGRSIARTLYLALGGSHGWSDRLKSRTEEKPNLKKIAGGKNFLHATFLAQESSVIICENSTATNCHLHSIYCERNSMIHAEFSDVSNSRLGGVVVTRGGMVNADTVIADGCTVGFWAHRQGVISASDSSANNCKGNGYRADTGGRINAHNTSASNTSNSATIDKWKYGGVGYLALRGGEIICTGKSKANNCIYGLMSIFGAKISAYQIISINCKISAIACMDGSQIEADESLIDNAKSIGVHCRDGSSVSLRAATIKNSGKYSILAEFGSNISGRNILISNAGDTCVYSKGGSRVDIFSGVVVNGEYFDLKVTDGSTISASKAVFSKTNIEKNKNNQNGIIFC